MITILEGFPDNVVAVRGTGHVTRADYETVLIPRVEAVARNHPKLRCYYEIGPGFTGMEPGAMWDDFKVGVEFWTRWDRVAVLTDVPWIAHAMNAFRFLMPGRIRVFEMKDKDAARTWVTAA